MYRKSAGETGKRGIKRNKEGARKGKMLRKVENSEVR